MYTLALAVLLGFASSGCISQPTDPGFNPETTTEPVGLVIIEPSVVEIYPGDMVQFDAALVDEMGAETDSEFDWEAAGGTMAASGMYTAGDESGEFDVEASAKGNGKATGRGKARVKIRQRDSEDAPAEPNQAPTASFENACTELDCSFDGSASTDADGSILAHDWTLGDGAEASGEGVTHEYGSDGSYTVQLTVSDDAGASSTVIRSVSVAQAPADPPPPSNGGPSAIYTHGCSDLACTFDASASNDPDGSIVSRTWSFGDGATGSGSSVAHAYDAGGTFQVRLIVTDDQGAADSLTKPVVVSGSVPPGDPLDATIYPGENIQAAIDANPSGATFVLKSGLHRMSSAVVPKAGQRFNGEAGAIVSGARLLTSFARDGSLWVASGQTQQNPNRTGECATGRPECIYPEDLFIDDQPLRQVLSKAEVGAGTFYFDYAGDRIYFADDPTGRKVEASVAVLGFDLRGGGKHNIQVHNVILEKFANAGQIGVIHSESNNDLLFQSNTFRLNHGAGLNASSGLRTRIIDNVMEDNGELGFGGWGPVDMEVAGNTIRRNNWAGYWTGWEGSALKIINSTRLHFHDNVVTDNIGKGIWIDGDNIDVLVENNRSERNTEHGIHHEIGYAAIYRNNEVHDNGQHGIVVTSSPNVQIYGNNLSGNGRHAIMLRQLHEGRVGRYGLLELRNALVRNNNVSGIRLSAFYGPTWIYSAGNSFRDNTYTVTTTRPFQAHDADLTPVEWRAEGHDTSGSFN